MSGYYDGITVDGNYDGVTLDSKKFPTPNPLWISVEDRLPKDHGIFLVCTETGTVLIIAYNHTDKQWHKFGKDPVYWTNNISYWMPLPDPPKKVSCKNP